MPTIPLPMPDSCNSRTLSWLTNSCIPSSPGHATTPAAHHRRTTVPSSDFSPISSLPDDLLLACLSRLPTSSLPALSLVSRRFSLLLDSPDFTRLRLLLLRPTLLAISLPSLRLLALSLPSPTWDPSLLPITNLATFSHARVAAIGRRIFILTHTAALCYDTWTGRTRSIQPTVFPRKKFAAAVLHGKIYVAGGTGRSVEEYDPETDAWRVVAEAPRRRYGCIGAAAGGVFYIIGGLPVRGDGGGGCSGSMDGYHVAADRWLRTRPVVPGGGCVVGACGAGGCLYVVASHAVELTFWRWEAGGRRQNGDGWVRMQGPPVDGGIRRGGAVRFSCAAVGETKVVALVQCWGRGGDAAVEGVVLVYDIVEGEWSRGPDLWPGFRRAAIACVEC